MSTTDLLEKIESLPADERLWLTERLNAMADAEVPESFRQSFAEAQRGEVIDLDTALRDLEEK
jgi:hypothetical protein